MYHVKTINQLFATIIFIIVLFSMYIVYDTYKDPIILESGVITDVYIIPRHEDYNSETDSLNIIPLKYYITISNVVDSDTITNEIEVLNSEYMRYRIGDHVFF